MVTLLSHARGRVFKQEINHPVAITRPKKPAPDNPSSGSSVFLDYFDPKDYWPDYNGPTTCLLAEAFDPVTPQMTITDGPFIQGAQATPGCFTYQSRAAQQEAGLAPTSNYSASTLICQLDKFLED